MLYEVITHSVFSLILLILMPHLTRVSNGGLMTQTDGIMSQVQWGVVQEFLKTDLEIIAPLVEGTHHLLQLIL